MQSWFFARLPPILWRCLRINSRFTTGKIKEVKQSTADAALIVGSNYSELGSRSFAARPLPRRPMIERRNWEAS